MKLFLQPFPHRIFTAADMLSTLADLGLSPSGSLVVKKKDCDQASTGTGESDISKSVLQWNPVNTDTKGTCDGVLLTLFFLLGLLPSFCVSRGFAAPAHALLSLNLKKKRDCLQSILSGCPY